MRRLVLQALFLLLALAAGSVANAQDPFDVTQPLGLMPGSPAMGAGAANQRPQAAPPKTPTPTVSPDAFAQPAQQRPEHAANLVSDVFGAGLFTGTFAQLGPIQFNPDYLISVGDRIQVRFWGGFVFDDVLVVDPQGNLFLPHVGPVKVLGVANKDLQRVVETAVRDVFRANVFSYASLAEAQPVRIFVGGFVHRPGLYNGTSMDSLLHYLDQAGGIDPARGTFLAVEVKRGDQLRAVVNLYDFLLEGRIPLLQLADGDVIFVPPRQNTTLVTGLAHNAKRFEFGIDRLTIDALARLAKPKAEATHVRVTRNTGTIRNVDYYALGEVNGVTVGNGDAVDFTADKKPGTITVRVEGEHESAQEYVLPYGARFGTLISMIEFSERSDAQSVQLFRRSVQERQKAMLQTALKSLESSVLTARSGTSDEARLRKEEAEIILQWVDRAREIEPTGQVLIAQAGERDNLLLEHGDIIRVPTRDGLVLVSGEVLFPNAIAFDPRLGLADYIQRAGGYTQTADNSRVIVAHRDGSYSEADPRSRRARTSSFEWQEWQGETVTAANGVRPGDEVLVLPKVDVKSRQIFKDMMQIIYQMAISARVVVGL